MLNSKKTGISPCLILGTAAVTGSLAYRKLMFSNAGMTGTSECSPLSLTVKTFEACACRL